MSIPTYAWVISGDTFKVRKELKARDFEWHPQAKVWAKEKNVRDFEGNLDLIRFCKVNGLVLTEELADNYRVGSKRWYRSIWNDSRA